MSVITDRLRPIRAHAASPQGTQTGIKTADLRETPIPNHEQKGSMGGPNITLVSLSTGRRSALQERPLPQCAHCGTRLLQLEFGVQPPIQAGFGGVGATVSVGRSPLQGEKENVTVPSQNVKAPSYQWALDHSLGTSARAYADYGAKRTRSTGQLNTAWPVRQAKPVVG